MSRGGLAALVASTLIAVVVVSVGSDGSSEVAAELPATAESTSQTATSLNDTESSASSLLDDVDGAALFEAGARDEMPDATASEAAPVEAGEVTDGAAADAAAVSADATSADATTDGVVVPRADLPAPPSTIAAASATAGAQIAPPTTAAPTTAPPTTAAPTTAAPTTAAPTTAAPTTAAPTTAPPTTAAPTTAAEPTPPPTPSTSVPVDTGTPTLEQWAALRACESGGRYSVISPNGLYHGAYQFAQSTWNGVARSAGRDDLVGVAPSAADPADQDAMALVLWTQRGSQPWPVCGRHLP